MSRPDAPAPKPAELEPTTTAALPAAPSATSDDPDGDIADRIIGTMQLKQALRKDSRPEEPWLA
jgi:hypothetical protein